LKSADHQCGEAVGVGLDKSGIDARTYLLLVKNDAGWNQAICYKASVQFLPKKRPALMPAKTLMA
jgi:hypothetical protein